MTEQDRTDRYHMNDTLTGFLASEHGWEAVDDEDYDALNDLTHDVADLIDTFADERAGVTPDLRAKIAKINALIASLPEDGSVLWLSTDESWGGATDLSIHHRDDLSEDVLDAYEIDLTAI